MKKKIIIFGAGAVGGYVGGQLARAGENILLIDPWPEHINCINRDGLHLSNPVEAYTVEVPGIHPHEVQRLSKTPVDIAIIATKSYDTEWAAAMIKQYLKPDGFIVSMQNGLNEERIAGIVGYGKTVGCVVSGISVTAYEAGHIMRTVMRASEPRFVFRVGEIHGRITRRVKDLAEMLSVVDGAKVTTNLLGERWTKLVVNCMHNAVAAVTGLNGRMIAEQEAPRRLSIRLGCEAIKVGKAMGYDIETIRGMTVEKLLAAGEGETGALKETEIIIAESAKYRTEAGRPSAAQDILKGRRTEIDFLNGLVVQKGMAVGLATPLNEAITTLVKRLENGELKPELENISRL